MNATPHSCYVYTADIGDNKVMFSRACVIHEMGTAIIVEQDRSYDVIFNSSNPAYTEASAVWKLIRSKTKDIAHAKATIKALGEEVAIAEAWLKAWGNGD